MSKPRKLTYSEDHIASIEAVRVEPSNRIACPKCGHENTITREELRNAARPGESAILHKNCGGCGKHLRYFEDRSVVGGRELITLKVQDFADILKDAF